MGCTQSKTRAYSMHGHSVDMNPDEGQFGLALLFMRPSPLISCVPLSYLPSYLCWAFFAGCVCTVDMSHFTFGPMIGMGAFGKVYYVRHKVTSEVWLLSLVLSCCLYVSLATFQSDLCFLLFLFLSCERLCRILP